MTKSFDPTDTTNSNPLEENKKTPVELGVCWCRRGDIGTNYTPGATRQVVLRRGVRPAAHTAGSGNQPHSLGPRRTDSNPHPAGSAAEEFSLVV